jgi:hypothetical protein
MIMGVLYLGTQLFNYWEGVKRQNVQKDEAIKIDPNTLEGLSWQYEKSLEISRQKGAKGLKAWLTNYRSVCSDPRLASIELDYVVLVNQSDPAEARRVFLTVRNRTPPNSPVFPRVRLLSKTYE